MRKKSSFPSTPHFATIYTPRKEQSLLITPKLHQNSKLKQLFFFLVLPSSVFPPISHGGAHQSPAPPNKQLAFSLYSSLLPLRSLPLSPPQHSTASARYRIRARVGRDPVTLRPLPPPRDLAAAGAALRRSPPLRRFPGGRFQRSRGAGPVRDPSDPTSPAAAALAASPWSPTRRSTTRSSSSPPAAPGEEAGRKKISHFRAVPMG